MMEKECTVLRVEKDRAELMTLRPEACKNCSESCSQCGTAVTFWVENTLNAKSGDRVLVWDSSSRFLVVCAILFFLPIVLSVAALLIATAYCSEITAVFVTATVFVLSFALSVLYLRRKKWDMVSMKAVLSE